MNQINSIDAFMAADRAMKQQVGTGISRATIGLEFAKDLYRLVGPMLSKPLTEAEFLLQIEHGAAEFRGARLKAGWL